MTDSYSTDQTRYVTGDSENPERFRLFRLCDCPTCEGRGQVLTHIRRTVFKRDPALYGGMVSAPGMTREKRERCPECRGEGRVRQELATCASAEAVGVAIVTLAREGEFEECPLGLLDQTPECEACDGTGWFERSWIEHGSDEPCLSCKGSGVKPTGTWLIRPWLPSARNVTDAARTLAKSKNRQTP